MRSVSVLIGLLSLLRGTHTNAFAFSPSRTSNKVFHRAQQQQVLSKHTEAIRSSTKTFNTALFEQKSPSDFQGTDRGAIIFAIVIALNIWSFTIPPEFRRAKFCSPEAENADCHCITFDNWKKGVSEYYASGGGIKFDFSIEDEASALCQN